MKHYYLPSADKKSIEEVTEDTWKTLVGDETIEPYAKAIYRDEITMADVPEEYRESVITIVAERIERWGEYDGNVEATEKDLYNALAELGVTDDEESDA